MRFVDLDGNTIEVKITNNILHNGGKRFSSLHKKAKELLRKRFPLLEIYDDVAIPIRPHKTLFIDLFVPSLNLAVEVHGRQHYDFIPRFHKSKLDFLQKQHNDELKRLWCAANNTTLVELPYNESEEEWSNKIDGR